MLLLDLGLPDGNGLDLIEDFSARDVRVIVFSVLGDEQSVLAAIERGAAGYLLKDTAAGQMREAIAQVLAGGAPLTPAVAGHLLRKMRRTEVAAPPADKSDTALMDLTAREREVLMALARGFSYDETATMLEISKHTVNHHIKQIYAKLAVTSRSQAVFEAVQAGWLRSSGWFRGSLVVSLLRSLLPTLALTTAFLLLILWLEQSARPDLPPITAIEARPAELPADLSHWRDDAPQSWQSFELPLKVCKIRCTTPYTAWRYRFQHVRGQLADPALYFPYTDANLALYLNGTLIELKGQLAAPPSVYRYDGRLIRMPLDLLKPGDNEIVWLLTIERRGTGSVMPFYLGNYSELESPLRHLRWLTDDLVRGSFWLQLTALLFALALLLRGSRERVVLWFALVSPFWLTIALWHLVPDWIVSTSLRFAAFYVSLFGMIAFSLLFICAILEAPPRWLTRSALAYFAIGTLLALGAGFWPDLDGYWRSALPHYTIKWSAMLILPYLVFRLYGYLDRQRDSLMAQWTLAAAVLPAVCGVHDAVRGSFGPMAFALYPISGLGISIAFCLELGRRVLANQARMARYSEELAATVRARELELADNYAKLKLPIASVR
ncbi:MAG: response regulator transcription factor [Rhodanobacteraceae bacterium]|nr:response regulator transcription factor [Rhodanobacteraceae bacterium]